MYYWDGVSWISTLSPDGRYRWDGTTWVPFAGGPIAPYAPAPPVRREPTSWTRPLQYAVAGWYSISAIVSLSLPFWVSGMMSQIIRVEIQRQQQLNPDVAPPPPSFYDAMNSMMTAVLWAAVIVGLAIYVVVIIGALQRWTWMYYLVLVFLGLAAVSGPADFVQFASGYYQSSVGYTPPTWLYVVGILSWVPSTALFVVMLIALVKRGPWGMVKVTGGGSRAA